MDWDSRDGWKIKIYRCSARRTLQIATWLLDNVSKKHYWIDYNTDHSVRESANIVTIVLYRSDDLIRFKLMGFSGDL